jgi:hypothetical protein
MRALPLVACALLLGLPAWASAAPPEAGTCAYLLGTDRVCVHVEVRGRSLGCRLEELQGDNNTTSVHNVCTAAFAVHANATSWPLPGGLRLEVEGIDAACQAFPDCSLGNDTTYLRTYLDPPPGAVLVLNAHAIAEQPQQVTLLGTASPALLSADVVASGSVRFG